MATIIMGKQMKENLKAVVQDRQKSRGETFFCWHHKEQKTMWGNNAEMTEQMKIWRKQRKEGTLKILEANNKTFKIQGREWHILVIQDTDSKGNPFDPMGMGYDERQFHVFGFIYHFTRIENRDAVYKYVMGK